MNDPKDDLHRYLQVGREAVLWKLEGLSEYDMRRPLVPTGTNLLGLVKHLASVELGYFGYVFDRPPPVELPWMEDDAEPNADMWATAEETSAGIVDLYHLAWAHSDATIKALDLEATAEVPWWPEERRTATLHRLRVHMATETHRHAGHADLVRELIDGQVGVRRGSATLPSGDEEWWRVYRNRVEQAAREADGSGA